MEILNEKLNIIGKITIRSHPLGTIETIEKLRKNGQHEEADLIIKNGKLEVIQKNMIVDSNGHGIDIFIQYLMSGYNGSFSFPFGPQWGEIGTNNNAPTLADTSLGTPTNRAFISYANDISFNQANLQFYFPDSVLMNGTSYKEFGTFIGGTSSIGTGALFNHALFSSPYVKSAGSDTTCEVDIVIANL